MSKSKFVLHAWEKEKLDALVLENAKEYGLKYGRMEGHKQGRKEGRIEGLKEGRKYNVPINVDTIRRRYPIKWTYQEGTKSLIVDTKIWVF